MVLDRAADEARLDRQAHGLGDAVGIVGEAVLEVGRDAAGRSPRRARPACASASSRVTEPSRRPSVAAKPLLVVASAWKPELAQQPRRADVPGVGQQQRLRARVQLGEPAREIGLIGHRRMIARRGAHGRNRPTSPARLRYQWRAKSGTMQIDEPLEDVQNDR